MTAYAQLKPSGELTKEGCRAILFNPNLTSYDHINKIAIENYIPASFVIAKLMKLDNPPKEAISNWIKKVPDIKSLWKFIGEIDGVYNKRSPITIEDRNRSVQQCHMDLTAHMSYILLTNNVQSSYKEWKSWAFENKYNISTGTRQLVLKLPSLRLLKKASLEPGSNSIVRAILNWDEKVIQISSQPQFRRTLILDLVRLLIAEESPGRAARVIRMSQGCLDQNEIADYTELIIMSWMSTFDVSTPTSVEIRSAKSLLSWAAEECLEADMHIRARLERLSAQLQEYGDGNRNTRLKQESLRLGHSIE
jgi:hypothetical protein